MTPDEALSLYEPMHPGCPIEITRTRLDPLPVGSQPGPLVWRVLIYSNPHEQVYSDHFVQEGFGDTIEAAYTRATSPHASFKAHSPQDRPPVTFPDHVAAHAAIRILNEALKADPVAINALFTHRVPVNQALANHPTIQVLSEPSPNPDGDPLLGFRHSPTLGALGLINGLFGVDEHQWGLIASSHENPHGPITHFMPTRDATDHPSAKKEDPE